MSNNWNPMNPSNNPRDTFEFYGKIADLNYQNDQKKLLEEQVRLQKEANELAKKQMPCRFCEGTGQKRTRDYRNKTPITCKVCFGTGRYGGPCVACNGTGYEQCIMCKGSGKGG